MTLTTIDPNDFVPDTRDAAATFEDALGSEVLTPPQRWGVVAAAAFTSTHGRLRERLLALAREAAGEDVLADAAGAA
ncbi:MAG: hypothetical protein ACRCSN_12815, partial [Dermatophilaceae bacterium]